MVAGDLVEVAIDEALFLEVAIPLAHEVGEVAKLERGEGCVDAFGCDGDAVLLVGEGRPLPFFGEWIRTG